MKKKHHVQHLTVLKNSEKAYLSEIRSTQKYSKVIRSFVGVVQSSVRRWKERGKGEFTAKNVPWI